MLIEFKERGMEGEKDGEKHQCERNIDLLPPQCALTGNQTHNLSVFGTMLQPTEPHQPGLKKVFKNLPE